MAIPVLTAVSGAPWEAGLVGGLEGRGRTIEVARRCVDIADLLAAAGAGLGRAVLLSADLRRLDRDTVTRLRAAGLAVVGLAAPGDPGSAERLAALGVSRVVSADAGTEVIAEAVVRAVAAAGVVGSPVPGFAFSAGVRPVVSGDETVARPGVGPAMDPSPAVGRVVAVWGPTGGSRTDDDRRVAGHRGCRPGKARPAGGR